MNKVDIILLIFLGFGAVKGYLNGFIVELFSLIAFFLGLLIALELTIPVSTRLFGDTSYFEVVSVIVFIGLFFLLSISIKMAAKALKKVVDFTFFGTVDNIIGAMAGAFKWAFIVSMLFWVFDSVGFNFVKEFKDESVIFPYIVGIGPKVFGWLSEVIPVIQDLMDSMDKWSNQSKSLITYQPGMVLFQG